MADIEKIVDKAVTGDKNAYTELYKLSYRQIYFTCLGLVKNRNDAEDITQETFLIIIKKLPKLKEKSKFHSWVKTIAINNCKKFLGTTSDISYEEKFEELDSELTDEELTHPDEYI
ncbi:MAG: RNA polymerase sigma factor [Oscillospiraceae bacterium]|nr:RNA polymerase sigma factor [Oscillospiraceae bacterium]